MPTEAVRFLLPVEAVAVVGWSALRAAFLSREDGGPTFAELTRSARGIQSDAAQAGMFAKELSDPSWYYALRRITP